MKLITQMLFLLATLSMLSCECEEEAMVNIECPCLDNDELPPYYKSCEEMGEDDERWKCMVNVMLSKVYKQLRYPEAAIEECVEGFVVVAILVNKEGNVLKTEIRNETLLGYGLEEEALRVVNLLNDNWCPGLMNCEPVESEYVLPIKYKLVK
ncbi:MAG: hypothetical protein ACI9P5_003609 [Saprospiraceae bacterium]|jgi:hypothetical protein|tara:strand:- start:169 stop:627 length:459 start_codon:yes stop_codon:yes gene_type:complete